MASTSLWGRIRNAGKAMARQSDRVVDQFWYQFLPAPTDPPTTRIQVRGGDMWDVWRGYYGTGCYWRVDPGVADLANPTNIYGAGGGAPSGGVELYDDTQNYDIVFANADYYRAYCLLIKPPAATGSTTMQFALYDFWTDTEYATAVEAETALMDGLGDAANEIWYAGYPLCGLVIRNNGATGVPGSILPIDRVNRGRSYMWPADVRPIDYSGV